LGSINKRMEIQAGLDIKTKITKEKRVGHDSNDRGPA
jgi:hypothetical protein